MTTQLTENEKIVYESMIEEYDDDYEADDGSVWGLVYIDNCLPAGMSAKSYTGTLAGLSKKGLYRPIDNYAWGEVLLP